jgi:histidinol-phosphate aminotransferase
VNREDVTALARRGVFTVEPWPVGKPLEEIVADLGLSAIALLATNENPLGASPRALEAMEEAIQRVNYYPGGPCVFLKRKLAGRLGVEENMVVFGNGADNCIRMVASAFLNEGEEVVLADPTFPVFSMFTRALGGVEVRVPLEGYVHDLEAMRQRVGPRTKLVYVCNPHNPTGSIVGRKEMVLGELSPQV